MRQKGLIQGCIVITALGVNMLLTGCVTVTEDAAFCDVTEIVEEITGQTPVLLHSESDYQNQQACIEDLLNEPLTPEASVHIALINNLGLQAQLSDLGITAADLTQAYRLPNPTLSYLRYSPVDDEYNISGAVLYNLMALLVKPLQISIEKQHFEQAKLNAAIQILMLAQKTQRAYYEAVAAAEIVSCLAEIKLSAKASMELAQDLKKVGNYNKLQTLRAQAYYETVAITLTKAEMQATKATEHLVRLLGLSCLEGPLPLPTRLPSLPSVLPQRLDMENVALCKRLDIQLGHSFVAGTAKALNLTKTTRFINVLDVGYGYNQGRNINSQSGYVIDFNVPLFDWGDAKVAKAEHIYMQSIWRLRDTILNAQSEIREAYALYEMQYHMAQRYGSTVLPLYQQIFKEDQLRYNGMLLSSFELLAEQRAQMDMIVAYVMALRDFWLEETALQATLFVKSPNSL